MARRKSKNGRRKGKKKVPILTTAGAAVGAISIYNDAKAKGVAHVPGHVVVIYTGYNMVDNSWSTAPMMNGTVPLVAGIIGSKIAAKIGINKYLAQVPIIGDYVKF